jgi:hypothetical protein
LTNTSTDETMLNSAVIRPPTKFLALMSASLNGQPGSISFNSTQVVLTGLGLAPGESAAVNVTVNATAGSVCRTTYHWNTHAYPSALFKNQLTLESSAGLSTTVTCGTKQVTKTKCTTNPCTTNLSTPVSDLEVSADPAAGTITETANAGSPLSCAAPANGGYTGFDTNWFGFMETGTVQKTLSYELFGLTSDQIGAVQICFGAPYEFTVNNGSQAAAGTLPNGTSGFVGLLPGCGAAGAGAAPCIQSIAPFSDDTSGLLVTVIVPGGTLPNGQPADPFIHG